jgi:carbon starvation protein CstA
MIAFILAVYVILGFGVSRMFNHIKSTFSKNGKDNIVTLFIWPMILIVIACNENIFDD